MSQNLFASKSADGEGYTFNIKPNMALETAVKLLRPEDYLKREKAESERVHSTDQGRGRLPVFSMPGALGKGMPVQLHFFEPRYRRLADRVAQGSRRFIWAPQAPEEATWGSVVEMSDFRLLRDGRSLMEGTVIYLAKLSDPILDEEENFHTMRVVPIEEVEVPESERAAVADQAEELYKVVKEKLPDGALESLEERTKGTAMEMPSVRDDPARFSHWLYEILGFSNLAEEFPAFSEIPAEPDVRVRLTRIGEGVDAVAERFAEQQGCVMQ